jgi:hypothetical protein
VRGRTDSTAKSLILTIAEVCVVVLCVSAVAVEEVKSVVC